ncbi:MAG: class I SAM-dependent RNA methyltransferase [Proteobacteria bacterium]|nr:class I SAM-dependent RNA methyltransferase [Pseudomonadota bacterium]
MTNSATAESAASSSLCKHFGTCGGCLSQDMPAGDYRAAKKNDVIAALAPYGFEASLVDDVISVPPNTRRRTSLKVKKQGGKAEIGFHARQSHSIVDMWECRVLAPSLVTLVQRLREMMTALLREGEAAELHLTQSDTGPDLAIRWSRKPGAPQTAEIARWAAKLKIARITSNGDVLFETAQPQIRFGNARVKLPPETFLQPTREGEDILQQKVVEIFKGAKSVADLFSGCGTFALPLAEQARVHAVELDAPMLDTLAAAARATQGLKPLTTEKRDLFKRPLTAAELNRFDAVLMDPPRAGALAQARELAQSKVRRIAYVSCDTATFARDARLLVDGGYHIGRVLPVDQFLWSSHIELVAAFTRG